MPDLGGPIGYFVVGAFGAAVGIGELVARYRDEPVKAMRSWAAFVYVAVNALASVAALAIIKTFGWFGAEPPTAQSNLNQVLIAGFGALAVFRSSLFVVRVGSDDVGIGPVAFLQVILGASDRGVDRKRGVDRAPKVAQIMAGLKFDEISQSFPLYAMALLQNVDPADAQELGDRIARLRDSEMSDKLKVLNVGLITMNVVGEDVLAAAASAFRETEATGEPKPGEPKPGEPKPGEPKPGEPKPADTAGTTGGSAGTTATPGTPPADGTPAADGTPPTDGSTPQETPTEPGIGPTAVGTALGAGTPEEKPDK
jgi:hypothetical protein